MKKITIHRIMAILITSAIFFVACTKEESDVRLDPKLSTSQVLNVKSDSATVVGFVVSAGDGFAEKGVCYNTATAPTTANSKVVFSAQNTQATFSVKLGGLAYATKYYARAYAKNASGTLYGEEIMFTTLPVVPTVTTATFTATSGTSATGGGNVTNNGGDAVTARGVCYSKKHNPIFVADSATSDGAGNGTFTSSLSKLKGLTTYYVRAYAKNSAGIAYGSEVSFTTPPSIVTLWAAGDFQNWNPGGATDSLMNSAADPIVQGYVYISNTNGFKFVAQKSWTGTAYGAGATAGTLSTDANAGNLSVSTPGYYFFKIDLANLTYTATKVTWGVIGAATAGGWASDQPMTYSTILKKWFATIPLTADQFKFRANGAWDINYGDGGNGTLSSNNAPNINCTTAGTYSVMLDLTSPLNYKYSLTQWAVIGDATAGGWTTDQKMTPNANNRWTITAAFVPGSFKFRANGTWDINYGGSGGVISAGGANITITTAGTYTITLDLVNGTYTIQ
ncbi:MAG: SusF/SusE family outer membrane protein [Bacteroidota bacterium]|nr:SusF/SusE family outer membrane protein [Bacteroidota bacterium]